MERHFASIPEIMQIKHPLKIVQIKKKIHE